MKHFLFISQYLLTIFALSLMFISGCTPLQLREAEAIERAAIAVEEDIASAEEGD